MSTARSNQAQHGIAQAHSARLPRTVRHCTGTFYPCAQDSTAVRWHIQAVRSGKHGSAQAHSARLPLTAQQ